jgi:3-hydroxyacyl-[acyl-carrier-protein] dehydratase
MIPTKEIFKILPHRYPFLLVDKIIEIDFENKFIRGQKNVTYNEQFFQGHFPGIPVMPGVLIVEAMAQTAGILAIKYGKLSIEDKIVYFAGIDKCKFRKPVLPGDVLILEATILKQKGPVWRMQGKALVDDNIVAEALLTATISDAN